MIFNMLQNIIPQSFRSNHFKTKKFCVGEIFSHNKSCLMIVDIRFSKVAGFEYLVLLDGEVHGWLTQSILSLLQKTEER